MASYLNIAGIPFHRIRITCGLTYFSEIGHATVHYYSDNDEWIHFNSTDSWKAVENKTSIADYPKRNQQSGMDIKDVWFSLD